MVQTHSDDSKESATTDMQTTFSSQDIQKIAEAAIHELERERSIMDFHMNGIQSVDDGSNSSHGGWSPEGARNSDANINGSRLKPVSDKVIRLENRLQEINDGLFTGICDTCKQSISLARFLAEPATRRHSLCKTNQNAGQQPS